MNYLKDIFFILASQSPRRIEFLNNLQLNFKSVKSTFKEELQGRKNPVEYVLENAYFKASSLTEQFSEELIAGFDTIVLCDDQILGKPKNKEDAFEMLTNLSNKTHKVLTGFVLLNESKKFKVKKYVETFVTFKELTVEEIEWYIDTKEPYDKAGAYAIQGIGTFLVKSINGSYSNVVGLPVAEFLEELRKYKENEY